MSNRQWLGISGSALLFIGVFLAVKLPIMGEMNYFANGRGDGVLVLLLAVTSLALVLLRWYCELWITALGSAASEGSLCQRPRPQLPVVAGGIPVATICLEAPPPLSR
jgi:hypothetical protein